MYYYNSTNTGLDFKELSMTKRELEAVLSGVGYWHLCGFLLFILGIITISDYYNISNILELISMFIGTVHFLQLEYAMYYFKKNSMTTLNSVGISSRIREMQKRQIEVMEDQSKVMKETSDFFLQKHFKGQEQEETQEFEKIKHTWNELIRRYNNLIEELANEKRNNNLSYKF